MKNGNMKTDSERKVEIVFGQLYLKSFEFLVSEMNIAIKKML